MEASFRRVELGSRLGQASNMGRLEGAWARLLKVSTKECPVADALSIGPDLWRSRSTAAFFRPWFFGNVASPRSTSWFRRVPHFLGGDPFRDIYPLLGHLAFPSDPNRLLLHPSTIPTSRSLYALPELRINSLLPLCPSSKLQWPIPLRSSLRSPRSSLRMASSS